MSLVRVLDADNLWIGELKAVEARGHRILLVGLNDGVRAYEDRCCHLGVPLSEGQLKDGRLICRAHGWEYDAGSGLGLNPRTARLTCYPVRQEASGIYVDVDAPFNSDAGRPRNG